MNWAADMLTVFILQFQWGTKDGLMFLIDCSDSMFAKEHDDEENMFDICIKVEEFVLLFVSCLGRVILTMNY